MILMFLGAWPLSSSQTLEYNVSERKLLPKNHPFVKALKKHIADGRELELIRILEGKMRRPGDRTTVILDDEIYAKIAMDDLNKGNYRSFYLEYSLRNFTGIDPIYPFNVEYVKKPKKRGSHRK